MYQIRDLNNNELWGKHTSVPCAIEICVEQLTQRYLEFIVDEFAEHSDDDGEMIESINIVVRKRNRTTFDVFTNGGDDVLRVELVTEPVRTFADLYVDE